MHEGRIANMDHGKYRLAKEPYSLPPENLRQWEVVAQRRALTTHKLNPGECSVPIGGVTSNRQLQSNRFSSIHHERQRPDSLLIALLASAISHVVRRKCHYRCEGSSMCLVTSSAMLGMQVIAENEREIGWETFVTV